MRTLDVTKLGIDRNFLRQCERQKLIKPKKSYSEWIVHEQYTPKDYSQEDIEIVWNAYLCRKMGLSYKEIGKLSNGEEIGLRDSMIGLIEKYESQIEELRALTEFMRYVKGFGFVPKPPNSLMGSQNFKEYLVDFIKYLDEDKKIKKIIDFADCISRIDDFESLKDDEFDNMEAMASELGLYVNQEISNGITMAMLEIKDMLDLEPSSKEIQDVIHKLYSYQKMIKGSEDLSLWDFASVYIFLFAYDSDLTALYKKLLWDETFALLAEAFVNFLIIEEPEKVAQIRSKSAK